MNPDVERAAFALERACRDAEPCTDEFDEFECAAAQLMDRASELLEELRREGVIRRVS